jgi:drug/metabolite transporter (DMT)-like permease
MRISSLDLLLLALVGVWGINYSIIKDSISGPSAPFTPFAFNAIRFAVAAAILVAFIAWKRAAKVRTRRDLLAIFGLGLVGNALYQILFITGMSSASSANSALILASVPVMVALIGVFTRVERLSGWAWTGIVLSFAGIAVVMLGNAWLAERAPEPRTATEHAAPASAPRVEESRDNAIEDGAPASPGSGAIAVSPIVGDALVLLSAMVWSIYTALAAPLLKRYSTTTVTALSLTAGTVPLVAIALPEMSRMEWAVVPLSAWAAAIFSGAFALALGYVVWNLGVKHLGGSRTAVYSNLTPLVAAGFAWAARGETLTRFHLIGAATILAGINLTRLGRHAERVELPAEE